MTPARHGTIIAGRYRLERPLGEGAAGVVWLASDMRERGQVWALKELDFSGLPTRDQAEMRELFDREARLLMRLEHPALPRVVDRFSESGHEYLVMERVEGPTLDRILETRGRPLDEGEVIGWGLQICHALQYLHDRQPPIVYRDLKPANLMLGVDGRIKLVDFGIARPLHPTRAGDTVAYGTPGFAPPEQYVGKAVPASDLYALGATLYRLLTRHPVGDPATPTSPFHFEPARRHNPRLSEGMEGLLRDCLQEEIGLRPPSAAAVAERLSALKTPPRRWWHLFPRVSRAR